MKLSREQILKIKTYFFDEGVCLVEDKTEKLHPELNIKEDELMKCMNSFVSRGMARKQFVWRHAYFFITDDGIKVLRDNLCYDSNRMPITHCETQMSIGSAVEATEWTEAKPING